MASFIDIVSVQHAGHKIPAIENLGVAKDHDAIDFTDNDISLLSNFPFSPRLQTLLLSRNRVRQIQSTLSNNVPNLHTIVLTANSIAELADLDPLRSLTKLTHLTLLENPVTRKEVRIFTNDNLRADGSLIDVTELPLLHNLANPFSSIP